MNSLENFIGSIESKKSTLEQEEKPVFSILFLTPENKETAVERVGKSKMWTSLKTWVDECIKYENPSKVIVQMYLEDNDSPIYTREFIPPPPEDKNKPMNGPLGLAEITDNVKKELRLEDLEKKIPQLEEEALKAKEKAEEWENKYKTLKTVIEYGKIAETGLGVILSAVGKTPIKLINGPKLEAIEQGRDYVENEQQVTEDTEITEEEKVRINSIEMIVTYMSQLPFPEFKTFNNIFSELSTDKSGSKMKQCLEFLKTLKNQNL